jgi:hypothetical protein
MKIYQRIAVLLTALKNCRKNGNSEWEGRHQDTLDQILANGPSGAGIDCGTKLISSASTPERLVFYTKFHHMDEHGGYDGWTVHIVVVTPSLQFGFHVRITGKDRNRIKDYLSVVYNDWLQEEVK